MSSHLEVSKPSGRELVPLTGQRLTLGKAPTNDVSLDHDDTVSRLHAVLENLGFAWSIRDLGSRNGTYINGEKITAERVLRSGDEVRIGKVRLLFWEVRESGDRPRDEETKAAQPNELPPRLTRREVDVLVVLCRPLVSDDPFPEPASVRKMAGELYVTEAAVKQHLQNMYDKFAIPTEGDRRVRLANEALRRGAVTHRAAARGRRLGEVERLDGRDRTFVCGPVGAPDAVQRRADGGDNLTVNRCVDRRDRGPFAAGDVVHLDGGQHAGRFLAADGYDPAVDEGGAVAPARSGHVRQLVPRSRCRVEPLERRRVLVCGQIASADRRTRRRRPTPQPDVHGALAYRRPVSMTRRRTPRSA